MPFYWAMASADNGLLTKDKQFYLEPRHNNPFRNIKGLLSVGN